MDFAGLEAEDGTDAREFDELIGDRRQRRPGGRDRLDAVTEVGYRHGATPFPGSPGRHG